MYSGDEDESMSGMDVEAQFERTAKVSLVDVSPSMLMALKERAAAYWVAERRREGVIGMSVKTEESIVAMFG